MTAILGISARFHDSAAAIVVDGEIVAAAQEERFSREKHDAGMPSGAVEYCLAEAGLRPEDLDYVAFYEKPLRRFERMLETYVAVAPAGFRSFCQALPLWFEEKLRLPRALDRLLGNRYSGDLLFLDHHESHAASAFFPSPFEEAAILTLDGVGEWATGTFGTGRGHRIELAAETRFPHSLGLLYSAFTYYLGFRVNDGEYKVMGLAPYGRPVHLDRLLDQVVQLEEDGSLHLDQRYFNYCQGLTMTSRRFHDLFGGPPRDPRQPLSQRHMDLAATVQAVTEEAMLHCARHVHAETGQAKLVLAGGVALNCVGNGRLLREGPFEDLWIQPAAGDAGGALGAALFVWHQLLDQPRQAVEKQRGSLLGPRWEDREVRQFLESEGIPFEEFASEESLLCRVAGLLEAAEVVGWFQGRMEFGPRALGNRSILGDPRVPEMQSLINRKIKYREGFRPFAPAVLADFAGEYFELDRPSPYMLLTAPVAKAKRLQVEEGLAGLDMLKVVRSQIPAVTHVDFSARVQTVDPSVNARFARLLDQFRLRTGCPVLVNTSFNVRDEPIVRSPADAYRCFLHTRMESLVLGSFLVRRELQRALDLGRRGTRTRSGPRDTDAAGSSRGARERAQDASSPAAWSQDWIDAFLSCPTCGDRLMREKDAVACCGCDFTLPLAADGVLEGLAGTAGLGSPEAGAGDRFSETVRRVREFYERNPFPSYDGFESVGDLLHRAARSQYAAALDRQLPLGARVLEVGCGTGQLGLFLSVGGRAVVGADISRNSLRLAAEFGREQGLHDCNFLHADLFRLPLREASFDLVLCKGVLHHTPDPRRGLERIASYLRPGGYLILGLYNRLARLPTVMRRWWFRLARPEMRSADYLASDFAQSDRKARSWFLDQYANPHESRHSAGEALRWLDEAGFAFVHAVPSLRLGEPFDPAAALFSPGEPSRGVERFLVQCQWLFTISREGGLFDLIARKRE
jgi:carbamoyltransferase